MSNICSREFGNKWNPVKYFDIVLLILHPCTPRLFHLFPLSVVSCFSEKSASSQNMHQAQNIQKQLPKLIPNLNGLCSPRCQLILTYKRSIFENCKSCKIDSVDVTFFKFFILEGFCILIWLQKNPVKYFGARLRMMHERCGGYIDG